MANLIVTIVNNEEKLYDGDLRHYYSLVFSAPNVNNPYHNFRHMMHVFCSTYEGAAFVNYQFNFGSRRLRALLIAALFHDYGHSGQMGDDGQEVTTAINFLQTNLLPSDQDLWPEIKELISATKFPHENRETSLGVMIIRDADMSQLLSGVWLQQIIFGLAQEMSILPLANLNREIDFLHSLEFQSDWGKQVLAPQIPERIAELKGLLQLLQYHQ